MADDDHELTQREQEVAQLIAEGASNKEAGRRLGISPRTVEIHRARIMAKRGARTAADLVRIVLSRSVESRDIFLRHCPSPPSSPLKQVEYDPRVRRGCIARAI